MRLSVHASKLRHSSASNIAFRERARPRNWKDYGVRASQLEELHFANNILIQIMTTPLQVNQTVISSCRRGLIDPLWLMLIYHEPIHPLDSTRTCKLASIVYLQSRHLLSPDF